MKKIVFYTIMILALGFLAAGCLGKSGTSNAEAKSTPAAAQSKSDDSDALPEGAGTKTTGDYLKEINKVLDNEDYVTGKKLCEEALQKDPNHSMLLMLLGSCYYHDGQYEEAVKYFTKSLDVEVNANQNYIYRGQAYIHLGKYKEAIADLDKVMKYIKEFYSLYSSRGMAHALDGDMEKAMVDFNKAIELGPESEVAFENRGMAYLIKGDYAKAQADLKKSMELNPDFAGAYTTLAFSYILQKNNNGAAEELDKVLKKTPENSVALYYKGLNELRTGKAAESRKDFEDAKRLDKGNENIMVFQALSEKYPKSEVGKAASEILKAMGIAVKSGKLEKTEKPAEKPEKKPAK
ncbi:MAG: tetratricopeptide repeat protein [Firmicutes bacterium]|nr:tetratricopeptide repeat protein [Bacillota bacterium]